MVNPNFLDNMAHWLFLPNDAAPDLAILASLSADQIQLLRTYLDSNEFRPRNAFYIKVAELLNIPDESAAKLCSFLNYVQSQRVRLRKDAASIPTEFEYFLKQVERHTKPEHNTAAVLAFLQNNKAGLVGLFSDLPQREYSEKVRGLEQGPLPHLHSFRTFCDYRPVFNADASEITSYLSVITISLSTHCTNSDKFEETTVQISESELSELKEAIARLDKKLSLLKKQQPPLSKKEG